MSINTPTTSSTPTSKPTGKSVPAPATHTRHEDTRPARRLTTETKSAFKTTEFIAYVVTVIAVLVASTVADEGSDFGARTAWFFVTLLTIGYMISRGLSKSGSPDAYDADNR